MKNFYAFLIALCCVQAVHSQDFQWALPLGTSNYDYVDDIAVGTNGNVYVVGGYEGTIDMDPGAGITNLVSAGGRDLFLGAYSAAGDLLWTVTIGSTQWDTAPAIHVDNAGNIIVAGGFRLTVDFDPGNGIANLTSNGNLDNFIAKFDPSGNLLWARSVGGAGEEEVGGLDSDSNNNIIISGLFIGTVDFDPGNGVSNLIPTGAQDVYVLKLDTDGNFVWAKNFGTTSGEACYSIAVDAADNIYGTGTFYGNLDFDPNGGTYFLNAGTFNAQAYIWKWTAASTFVWAGMFGGSLSDSGYGVDVDSASNVYVTGYFAGNGDFDIGGGTFNMDGGSNASFPDLFVLKMATDGTFVWAKSAGALNSTQQGYAISVKPNGESWITGLTAGTVDYDPGAGVSTIVAQGSSDAVILHLDGDGNFISANQVGGIMDDYGSVVTTTASDVMLGGLFSWSAVDLDPTSGVDLHDAVSLTSDGYVIKLGTCTPPPLTLSATEFSCGGGTATVVTSENGTFTYLWNDSNSQTSQTAVGLNPGDYTVTVTNDSGCAANGVVTVPTNSCPADFNNDTIVNVSDLLMFMAAFGTGQCPYDMDNNGIINITDLLMFMAEFGNNCE